MFCEVDDGHRRYRQFVDFSLAAAQLTSWSLILYGTADAPRVLADYLSSSFVHQSSTQTRQASTANLETTVHQPPSTGESSAAAATTVVMASSASGWAATTEVSSSVVSPTYVDVERNTSTGTAYDRLVTVRPTSALNFTQGGGLTSCDLGRVLFEGKCLDGCPAGYFPYNQTVIRQNASKDREPVYEVATVCLPCSSIDVCPTTSDDRLFHWVWIALVCTVCLSLFVVTIVCLVRRWMCVQPDYEILRYHRPLYHVDIIGLHDKHLLSSDSESSSDEVELNPKNCAEHSVIQETS